MTKGYKRGWYLYETVSFVPPYPSSIIAYECSKCGHRGAWLLPATMTIDDDLYCGECGCLVVIKEKGY